ncbi:MAG: creatininase family protein, partial [Candidatus Omnitrophica bacterium]|nr:creatininase family protein [Candidatus Omnitrophota bacterium]
MLWHEQRWTQLEKMDKDTPVLIPLGSCEQHGHHLPVYVDTIQVTAIAERAEKALGKKVLLLPTLWLGSSHHHLDFPGTVSVLPSLYSQMIKSVANCILDAGFKRLLFLNGHGGNKVPAAQALS